MLSLSYLRKGMHPQPVYVAQFDCGATKRITFFSLRNKPLDIETGRRCCQSLTSMQGRRLIAGYVEIDGDIAAYDNFDAAPAKRKRGPTAKACLAALQALLDNPGYDSRMHALELVEQAA